MTQAEQKKYRETLIKIQARLRGDISHLAEEAMGSGGEGVFGSSGDDADVGTDISALEGALSLLQNEEHVLEEIADALERLDQGTFGICEECNGKIPKGRLQALPYVRHCVPCAREHQQSL